MLRNEPASQLFHLPLQTDPATETRSNLYIVRKQVALAALSKYLLLYVKKQDFVYASF